MKGIRSPVRASPSPKKKGRRSPTPPSKRTKFLAQADEQPFRPTPLTPVAWDVTAAENAGTPHPSEKTQLSAINAWDPEHPNNPHTIARKALAKQKQEERKSKGGGKGSKKAQADPKAKATSKGRGRGKGFGKGKKKGGKGQRVLRFNIPSKGKGRGKGQKG